MDIIKANLLGSILAVTILALCCLVFVFRLAGSRHGEFFTGILFMLTAIPLIYLLAVAGSFDRPSLYFIQIGLMLAFIAAELVLDYLLKVDFRHVPWMTVCYVTLFFAATGGMVGIAANSGKLWTIVAVAVFLVMTFLALYQRRKTGM